MSPRQPVELAHPVKLPRSRRSSSAHLHSTGFTFSPKFRPSAAGSSSFRRPEPKFRRQITGSRPVGSGSRCQEGAAASRGHPDRISLQYRRKTASRGRISTRAPGKKGMRGYFVMVMLVDVDLSQLVVICDELHAIFAMGKLGLEEMLGFVS